MCGICGVMADDVREEEVWAQLQTLRHRGPDSVGVHVSSGAVIGQARLAVIDLITGDPPICGEDQQVAVSLNGEIYNFRELRLHLRAGGHAFKTDGDTEVIAHLAEELEPADVCRQLDGMFALAVWDSRLRRLFLARDRLGKKPLYYWRSPDGDVVFGSEIKALLNGPRVPRRLATNALDAYLTFGYVPTPYTFYDEILSVPPGHVITFDQSGKSSVERYWRRPAQCDSPPTDWIEYEDAGSEVRRLLSNAVEKRLIADVPIGAFLSGGVDSTAVVALMARLNGGRVRTFTIGFEDRDGFDERPYARKVAALFGTEHSEHVVKPEKVDLIERLVWHHDQPFGDSSALLLYLLSEVTRSEVKVALSGDGGDELFAGYERFSAAALVSQASLLPDRARRRLIAAAEVISAERFGSLGRSVQRMICRAGDDMPWPLMAWVSFVPDEWRRQLLPVPDTWAIEDYGRIWAESAGADTVNRVLDLNLRTYLLDDLLPKTDRMSMAHGLEVRSPFLDTELLEFALTLPGSFKLRGWSRKRVLKEAVRDIVPRELLHRRKRGFGVPLDRWFRTDLRPYVESMIGSPSSRLARHLNHDAVQSLLTEHMAGSSHGHSLWSLLTLEVFLRREDW